MEYSVDAMTPSRKAISYCYFFLRPTQCLLGSALVLYSLLSVHMVIAQQYHFRNLGIEQGLTSPITEAVVEDNYGFVWITTESGVSRFDGSAFKDYYSIVGDSTSLMNKSGENMFLDKNDQLWISMVQGGISRYLPRTDSFKNYAFTNSPKDEVEIGSVHYHYHNAQGELIIRTLENHSFKYSTKNDQFEFYHPWSEEIFGGECYPVFSDSKGRILFRSTNDSEHELVAVNAESGDIEFTTKIPSYINTVYEDELGTYWIGTWGRGIFRYHPELDSVSHFLPTEEEGSLPGFVVEDFEIDHQGNLWIATLNGLAVVDSSQLQSLTTEMKFIKPINSETGEPLKAMFKDIECDNSGRLWFATEGDGVYVHSPHSIEYSFVRVNDKESENDYILESNYFFEDENAVQWYAFQDKLLKYNSQTGNQTIIPLQKIRTDDGGVKPVISINQAADGRLTVSYLGGTSVYIDPETFEQEYFERNGGAPGGVNHTLFDSSGTLWVSTEGALLRHEGQSIYRFDTIVPAFDGQEIIEDKEGNIWVGSWSQGVARIDPATLKVDRFQSSESKTSGLLGDDAKILEVTSDGRLVTMTSKGLHVFNDTLDRFQFIDPSANHELQLTDYFAIDHDGNFWFSSLKGIYYWKAKIQKVMFLDADFGLPQTAYYGIKSSVNGDIFVSTGLGCLRFDPSQIPDPATPSSVKFTSIVYEDSKREESQSLFDKSDLELSFREDFIEIDFAPLNFDITGKVNYEYMLDGGSGVWVDIEEETKVSFLDLPHGEYVLKVRGRNDWDEYGEVAEFRFSISPPWRYSKAAIVTYIILLVLAVISYTRWRTNTLRKRQRQLELIVDQRTEEIRIERDKSDELLLNILPEQVADELKMKGEAEAKMIDEVTVLFTDFKGFTALSEKLSPKDLVKDLNDCFSAFDRICEKHGIEKIKTIGDAYMAAGGLPTPNKTHTVDVINVAFEFRDFIESGKQKKIDAGLPYFEIRIGVHTGPVVAGIVGVKKFQYDIWGDTVNTASRMESSGEVGMVNISEATFQIVKENPHFDFVERGKIAAKGKGEIEMYFVNQV
ncbi:MAG: adenylate/guanylate cyclase domain-containing protein [Bacteroidota bacterium]